MRFGKTLRHSIYPPWKDKYIDYQKLKTLLRESDEAGDTSESEDLEWTEHDEEAYVHELINVQLDKVNAFQVETSQQLRERTSACELKLRPLAPDTETEQSKLSEEKKKSIASDVLLELDRITEEVSELEKYSRVNFTGFLKAAKKHDRKRGTRYHVKPLLQVRLSELPFNSEDYSPLVRRLSIMYSFAREILSHGSVEPRDTGISNFSRDAYSSYRFWVHADNILEVKMYILRRLPSLIYDSRSSKDLDTLADDPTITSLYFDNPQFDLYSQKVAKVPEAGSLRLRWTGQLKDTPTISLEKKLIAEDDRSREVRVQLKLKHVKEFLDGKYRLDKDVHRLETNGNDESAQAELLRKDVSELQSFIQEHNLQPMLRANYTRAAFQVPGDDRIRISLDTNLALIREDSLDLERPCRDPNQWHRVDLDEPGMEYPFDSIKAGEISRFPHGLLEIKLRGRARDAEWINDLMASHLVKEAPRFSKFVHGVAQLFEDHVNSLPFWIGDLENDIRRDPETAFHEEQEKIARRVEDDMVVGSFFGSRVNSDARLKSPTLRLSDVDSPPYAKKQLQPDDAPTEAHAEPSQTVSRPEPDWLNAPREVFPPTSSWLSSLFPYFQASRQERASHADAILPPGVRDPGIWIKNSGPVRVESKVWLANQRTFIKWLHISILLSSLSMGLYNTAGRYNDVARVLSIVYTAFALFAAAWGWYMYEKRVRLIRLRSGQDLDNIFGPIIICVGLAAALIFNFAFKYSAVRKKAADNGTPVNVEVLNPSTLPPS